LILTIACVVGVSYAIWQITLQQTDTNVITTGCFKVEFSEKNPISLNESYPITDNEGKKLIPYEFTITNTCDSYATYQINLEVLNSTTLSNLDYIKVMLEDSTSLLTSNETTPKTLEEASFSYKLETGYLDALASKTFSLRIWMDEDTPTMEEFMNKTFQSKVTIISSFTTDFDYESPVVDFVVKKEENKVIVDASSSTDNDKIKYYYYSKDGENYIKTRSDTYIFEEKEMNYGIGTTALIEFEQNTVNEVFVRVEDEYGNQSEVKTLIVGDLLYDETSDNNLRYVGATPNNYVLFNNELWRIIGVMNHIEDENGRKDTRLKLIKNISYRILKWDDNNENNWVTSSINNKLNQEFYNNILEADKKFIQDVVWNLGRNNSYSTPTVNEFYNLERGEFVYGNTESKWLGKIGLIYPSDYGFATAGSDTMSRNECVNNSLNELYWNASDNCRINNYLYHNHEYWTITTNSLDNYRVYSVYQVGSVSTHTADFKNIYIYPSFFLKSEVKIVSGNGSEQMPFELSLN